MTKDARAAAPSRADGAVEAGDRLVVFDIDGTLLDNRRGDDDCYELAFRQFGIRRIDMDWAQFPHCTDSFVTREILRRHLGRAPTQDELRSVREAYLAELRAASASGRAAHAPMRGARKAIKALKAAGWTMALSTGGWRECALHKLRRSRLPVLSIPAAFADDDDSREVITALARRRAEEAAGRPARRVVCVGDAVWDLKACAALGLPFVGIGRADRGLRLRFAGAATVLDDFSDVGRFLDALACAVPPQTIHSPR